MDNTLILDEICEFLWQDNHNMLTAVRDICIIIMIYNISSLFYLVGLNKKKKNIWMTMTDSFKKIRGYLMIQDLTIVVASI